MLARLRPPAFLFLFGCGLLSGLAGCEFGADTSVAVPAAARQALHRKFGTHLEQLRWQPDQDRLHASFTWKTIPVDVWLTPAGHLEETQLAMLDEDVPPALRDTLRRYYATYQRQAMHLVETPAGFHYNLLLAAPGASAARYFFRPDGHRLPHPLKTASPTY